MKVGYIPVDLGCLPVGSLARIFSDKTNGIIKVLRHRGDEVLIRYYGTSLTSYWPSDMPVLPVRGNK